LSAAGTAPDAAYPPDGQSILGALTQNDPPAPRQLFWRYKANAQRASRDGNFKILKIRDNTFLFDVVADPLERANLKERKREVYDRMVKQWDAWNATMMPETKESTTGNWSAPDIADHYGSKPVTDDVDDTTVWP
jgi:hypothetical protein